MSDRFRRTSFSDAVITETVRLADTRSPVDDKKVMQLVHEGGYASEDALIQRAWLLGNDLKLTDDLHQWRRLLRYTMVLLVIAAVLIGAGLASSVMADRRTLNAPYALLLALGPHGLALLLWLPSLLRPELPESGSLGSLVLRGLARLPFSRGPHFWTLMQAATGLVSRHRLLPWLSGIASHLFWSVVLLVVLVMLALRFSFQAYQLTWETTILPAEFFVRFVQVSGWLPQQLGVPLPDTSTVLDPAAPGSDHRAWAWWLIACISLYGLLPRLLLLTLSWGMWRWRKQAVQPDFAQPYYVKLLARFHDMHRSAVVDPEQRPATSVLPLTRRAVPGEAQMLAVIGFELPEEQPWPPEPMERLAPSQTSLVERTSGSIQERRAVLDKLNATQPYRLLFVCNPEATPDRGTASFIREAAAHAVRCAIWLPASSPSANRSVERWSAWRTTSQLEDMRCLTRMSEFLAWMEEAHE